MRFEMKKRLTKRYLINTLEGLPLSKPIRYERYYINDNIRVQKKNDFYEKEILDKNIVIKKEQIEKETFEKLKQEASKEIIRDSYLYLLDDRVSIKKYYGMYDGLIRVEVSFLSEEERNKYQKETWMQKEITNSPLAFDKDLSKLDKNSFIKELNTKR